MLLFIFSVIVSTFLFISFVVMCFSEDINNYLRAKTEVLKVQAEMLREMLARQAGDNKAL